MIIETYPNEDVEHREDHSEGSDWFKGSPGLLMVRGFASPDWAHGDAPENIKNDESHVN